MYYGLRTLLVLAVVVAGGCRKSESPSQPISDAKTQYNEVFDTVDKDSGQVLPVNDAPLAVPVPIEIPPSPAPVFLPPAPGPIVAATFSGSGGGGSPPDIFGCRTDKDCNDHNPCTIGTCEERVCVYTFDESKTTFGSCETDGNPCTAGKCVDIDNDIFCYEQPREFISEPVGCLDDNQCTSDSCVVVPKDGGRVKYDDAGNIILTAEGQCIHEVMDNSPCFVEEFCQTGACTLTGAGVPGDDFAISCIALPPDEPQAFCPNTDFNVCTTEACVVGTGCVSTELPDGTSCNDFDPCSMNDECQTDPNTHDFYCFGTPRIYVPTEDGGFDDENPCTEDICSAGVGTHIPLNGPFGPYCETGMPGICNDGDSQCLDGVDTSMCIPMFRPGNKVESCALPNGLDDDCDGETDECHCPEIPDGATFRYVSTSGDDGTGGSNDCTDPSNPCATIAHAIAESDPGDAIFLAAGTYNQFGITVNKNIFIYGAGAQYSIVDAQELGRIFLVNNVQATFCDLTLANASITDPDQPAADTSGGAIRALAGSTTTISHCILRDNAAVRGAAATNLGTMIVEESAVNNNTTTISGGGLRNENSGSLTVTNSFFNNNTSPNGGAIINVLGTLTVTGSTFNANSSSQGGAITNLATMTLTDSTFTDNSAYVPGINPTGGALVNFGTGTITGTSFTGNSSVFGGAIRNFASGTLNISESLFQSNVAFFNGGAIDNTGTLSISLTTVSQNSTISALGVAGGISNFGRNATGTDPVQPGIASITDSTISYNSSTEGGGLVNNGGTVTLTRSTVDNNSGANFAGGLNNFGGVRAATLTIINSTISGNVTSITGSGGGIVNSGLVGTKVTIDFSTIAFNFAGLQANSGGGIKNFSGVVEVKNSIVAENTPQDCDGSITSLGNNINSDTTCSFGPATDPLLEPLQNNGGPTFTHELGPTSPAIDAAACEAVVPTDQRGEPRATAGTTCDIGSFEVQP